MHNQPHVGRIALCTTTRKKLLKSGEIRDFYGNSYNYIYNIIYIIIYIIGNTKFTTTNMP